MQIVNNLIKIIDEEILNDKERMVLTFVCDGIKYSDNIDLNLIDFNEDNLICSGTYNEVWINLNKFSKYNNEESGHRFWNNSNSYLLISFI